MNTIEQLDETIYVDGIAILEATSWEDADNLVGRVKSTLDHINTLQAENEALRQRVAELEGKLQDAEKPAIKVIKSQDGVIEKLQKQCEECNGQGSFECSDCDGKGYTVGWDGNYESQPYQQPCSACSTMGKHECTCCDGEGVITD